MLNEVLTNVWNTREKEKNRMLYRIVFSMGFRQVVKLTNTSDISKPTELLLELISCISCIVGLNV